MSKKTIRIGGASGAWGVGAVTARTQPSGRRRRPLQTPSWDIRRPKRPQSRAVAALVIVSSVVNVLEEIMNSVSAASRSKVSTVS